MLDNRERKLRRLNSIATEELSPSMYNLYLGGFISYGLFMNMLSVIFFEDFFLSITPKIFIIAYFVSCFAGIIISVISQNPFISFIGYNFVVLPIGGLLTICLRNYEGANIISAITVTGIVVVLMTIFAMAKPDFFGSLGKTLFLTLIISFIAEIVAMLMGYGGNLFNWLFVIIFSLYIGYDYVKSQEYPKTIDNAVDSALDIYLDIINIFVRLLEIFSDD